QPVARGVFDAARDGEPDDAVLNVRVPADTTVAFFIGGATRGRRTRCGSRPSACRRQSAKRCLAGFAPFAFSTRSDFVDGDSSAVPTPQPTLATLVVSASHGRLHRAA